MTVTQRVGEIWRFREVIKNFVSQDLKVRYRRSVLGFFWSLLNPLLQMTVITVVFRLIFRFPIENFALYVLSGLIPWTFIATTMDGCTMSVVSAEGMIKRQYFPKLAFPLSMVLQNLVTFVLSLTVLLVLLAWPTGFRPNMAMLMLPVSFLCIFCIALGMGALAAVLTVYFRDMQHLISVLMSAWFYLTPIIYPLEAKPKFAEPPPLGRYGASAQVDSPTSAPAVTNDNVADDGAEAKGDGGPIPQRYRWVFKLNPLYSVIEMFHRPIYDGRLPTRSEFGAAMGTAVLSLFVGLGVFWRFEDRLIFAL